MKFGKYTILNYVKPKKPKPKLIYILIISVYIAAASALIFTYPQILPPESEYTVLTTEHSRYTTIFPIDINKAKAEDFAELDGIGDALAERIVEYRNVNGYFDSVYGLADVSGIGKATVDKNIDKIYVDEAYCKNTDTESDTDLNINSSTDNADDVKKDTLNFPINLNTSSADELSQIPEVSMKLAEKIVLLREKIGKISVYEELWLIDGIKGQQFESIKSHSYIE